MTKRTTLKLSNVNIVFRRVDSFAPIAIAHANIIVTPNAKISGYLFSPSTFIGKFVLKKFSMACPHRLSKYALKPLTTLAEPKETNI